MKIIRPHEVDKSIISLIDDAKVELIVISPYNRFATWASLKKSLRAAIKRGVRVHFYVKSGETHSGPEVFLVPITHSKNCMQKSISARRKQF